MEIASPLGQIKKYIFVFNEECILRLKTTTKFSRRLTPIILYLVCNKPKIMTPHAAIDVCLMYAFWYCILVCSPKSNFKMSVCTTLHVLYYFLFRWKWLKLRQEIVFMSIQFSVAVEKLILSLVKFLLGAVQ